jgi:hypothetical protein
LEQKAGEHNPEQIVVGDVVRLEQAVLDGLNPNALAYYQYLCGEVIKIYSDGYCFIKWRHKKIKGLEPLNILTVVARIGARAA